MRRLSWALWKVCRGKKPKLCEVRGKVPLETIVKMGKGGGLWLLTKGGMVLLDLQTCSFRLGICLSTGEDKQGPSGEASRVS